MVVRMKLSPDGYGFREKNWLIYKTPGEAPADDRLFFVRLVFFLSAFITQ